MNLMDQLVTRQINLWKARMQVVDVPRFIPNITLSREFGAGGGTLSKALAERIGFALWGKELIGAVAEKTGADEAVLHTLDETTRNHIEDIVMGLMMGEAYTEREFALSMARVTASIALGGQAIFLGRGAHYLLKSRQALKVRVICPLERRVQLYAARAQIDEKTSRRLVEENDRARVKFIKARFKRDLTTATDYDLLLNSSVFDTDAMIAIIIAAYEAKFEHALTPVKSAARPI